MDCRIEPNSTPELIQSRRISKGAGSSMILLMVAMMVL